MNIKTPNIAHWCFQRPPTKFRSDFRGDISIEGWQFLIPFAKIPAEDCVVEFDEVKRLLDEINSALSEFDPVLKEKARDILATRNPR